MLGWSILKVSPNSILLNLRSTRITDAGLEHLKGLTKLQWLILQDTKVTDAGLEHLKGSDQTPIIEPCEDQGDRRWVGASQRLAQSPSAEPGWDQGHRCGREEVAEGNTQLQDRALKCPHPEAEFRL